MFDVALGLFGLQAFAYRARSAALTLKIVPPDDPLATMRIDYRANIDRAAFWAG